MAQRHRCPGGRPSVSYNSANVAKALDFVPSKATKTKLKQNNTNHIAVSQRVQEAG